MDKYIVRLEFDVKSVDLLDIEVKATSREDAITKAKNKYYKGEFNGADFYASDAYEIEMSNETECDWLVENLTTVRGGII